MAEEIIIDEMSLVNHIATGGSTQVWEVVDRARGNQHFAMKILLPEALADPEQKAVLKHEAKLAEKFDHPNLVKVHKLVLNKKRGYLVMDYFRAPNLKMQIQSDLAAVQVRFGRLLEQLCEVLRYLHESGWVHRDLKPDNILFNKSSELRLIDFSLTTRAANVVSKMIMGKEKVIQGTRTYISPETILKAPPSPLADIYSLGVTLFEILTGEPPFRGSSPDDLLKKHLTTKAPEPSSFNPNVTPEMDRMIVKMLSKKPKNRHQNTHEILAEFRNIKAFLEDPLARDRRLKKEQEERYKVTLDRAGRLDSRADAQLQQIYKENPEMAKERAARKAAEAAKTAAKVEPSKPGSGKTVQPAAASKPQQPPATGKAASRSATPAAPAAATPPAPQMPMMPGYPQPPYGYPGYGPPAYHPMPGYPAGAYPVAGYPQPGYQPMGAPPYMPPPQPAGPGPVPLHPGGVPPAPYAAPAYASSMHLPPAPVQPTPIPPAAARPQQPLDAQQELLRQLMGQPAPPARPGGPAPPRPAANPPGQQLPLMDQLPPVK